MIFTFYSYKGGVGRSMALANVAEWLRVEGAHVVMIDWDLEAPGLENYFFSGKADLEKARRRPGLLDLLLVYREHFERTARLHPGQSGNEIAERAIRSLPNLLDFLQPIHSGGDEGSLWLISAGSRIDSGERSGAPPPPPAEDVGLDASEYAAVLAQARKAGEASGDTVAHSATDTLSPDKYVEEMRKAASAATPNRPRTGGR